ncbi:ABC transporter ATP-binding protein [Caenispirillum salinarum]|uniref:ABC transporter ATP-binding protein n=1 Tax=Caenispirillum salinarum TaxID=859058 RepID=UPI00384D053E
MTEPRPVGPDSDDRHPPFPATPFSFTWWVVRRFVPGRAAALLVIIIVSTALQAVTPYVLGRFVDTLEAVSEGLADRDAVTDLFVQAAPNLFESIVLPFSRVAVTMVVAGVLLWTAQPSYAYAFAGFAAVFIVVSVVMARHVGAVIERLARARSMVSGRIADIIGGNALVRSFTGETFERRTLAPLVEEEYRRARHARFAFTAMRMGQLVLSVGFMSVLTWHALQAAMAGAMSAGTVAMILAVGLQLTMSITMLGDDILDAFEQVGNLQESLAALARPRDLVDAPDAVALPDGGGRVQFRDVTFRYGGRSGGTAVVKGITLAVEPGDRVGLVGYSGAGKSTLLKLLTRQYDVDQGAVTVGGRDVRSITQGSLRRCFAEVSQATDLFHRSIRDNIRYGRPDASDAEVEAAARAACCHEFIIARPGGYDAIVGERGVKLSGGERQRIAIARAILKDAPILLLDEATASLDSESEALIQQALEVLVRGRTVIAIAHRLSTIASMDRIIVLHHGRIVEQGSHAALLARNGRYADLWRRQHGSAPVHAACGPIA